MGMEAGRGMTLAAGAANNSGKAEDTVGSTPMTELLGHVGAEGDDPPDGLVAHDLTEPAPLVFVGVSVDVAAADAGGVHLEQHPVVVGGRVRPAGHHELPPIFEYQCSHGSPPSVGFPLLAASSRLADPAVKIGSRA